MSRQRGAGFSVIEIIIAVMVAAIAFATFLSVFRSSYQYASMTRNRAAAMVLGRSLLEEIEAHPYGSEAPRTWSSTEDVPVQVWIEGRPVDMRYHTSVRFLNSSFVDPAKSTADFDVVTLTISWRESETAVRTGDNQQLQLMVPVWR